MTKVTWDEIALGTDSTVRVIYLRGKEAVISIGAVFRSTSIKMFWSTAAYIVQFVCNLAVLRC